MKQQDTYKEVVTIQYANAVARVHIPDLTQEERERRLERIGKRAVELFTPVKK